VIQEISELKVKLFADGADLNSMLDLSKKEFIQGLTTNPTLMRKAGIKNYRQFAKEVLAEIKLKPVSFEVFSDDFDEMVKQGLEIASWGENVNVKIPITNSKGMSTGSVIKHLSGEGVSINATALMTVDQVKKVLDSANSSTKNYISIFAGRIADTGRDPVPLMKKALQMIKQSPNSELIWASPREVLNVFQANEIGCHIITATPDILKRLDFFGKDLIQYSLETVQMFRQDAIASQYTI